MTGESIGSYYFWQSNFTVTPLQRIILTPHSGILRHGTYFENVNKVLRSSHRRFSVKKGVLKNLTKFTGKHLRQCLFFKKVAGLGHRCFPVNFVKFLRTAFLQNTSGRLLLTINIFEILLLRIAI